MKRPDQSRAIHGLGSLILFQRAGLQAEDGIGRAEPEDAGQQWKDADPAPDSDHAGQCQANKGQADNHAQETVDTANVESHFSSLDVVAGVHRIGAMRLLVSEKFTYPTVRVWLGAANRQ